MQSVLSVSTLILNQLTLIFLLVYVASVHQAAKVVAALLRVTG